MQGIVAQKLSAPAKAESAAKRVLVDLTKNLQDLQKESRSVEVCAGVAASPPIMLVRMLVYCARMRVPNSYIRK